MRATRSCSDVKAGTSLPYTLMRRLVMLVLHVLHEKKECPGSVIIKVWQGGKSKASHSPYSKL